MRAIVASWKPAPVDVAVVRLVRGQVDALCRVGDRHLLIVQRLRLAPQVAQERLEVGDLLLLLERLAVAGHDGFEIERLQLLEVVRPLVVEAEVERAGRPALRRSRRCAITFSFGRYTIDVGVAVAAAEIEQPNLAVAAEDRQVIRRRSRSAASGPSPSAAPDTPPAPSADPRPAASAPDRWLRSQSVCGCCSSWPGKVLELEREPVLQHAAQNRGSARSRGR